MHWECQSPKTPLSFCPSRWLGLPLHSIWPTSHSQPFPLCARYYPTITTLCSPVIPSLPVLNRHRLSTVCFLGSYSWSAKQSWGDLWNHTGEPATNACLQTSAGCSQQFNYWLSSCWVLSTFPKTTVLSLFHLLLSPWPCPSPSGSNRVLVWNHGTPSEVLSFQNRCYSKSTLPPSSIIPASEEAFLFSKVLSSICAIDSISLHNFQVLRWAVTLLHVGITMTLQVPTSCSHNMFRAPE